MKPVLKTSLISLGSAIIGGAIVLAALKYNPTTEPKTESKWSDRDAVFDDILKKQEGIQHNFDSLFDDNFFNQNDPFEEMKRMRKQMEKRMGDFGAGRHSKSNPFDSWFSDKFGGGTIYDISKREDGDFVYYDVQVDYLNATSINTKIENGYITITGSLEKKSESSENDSSTQSVFKSTFNRTFPLPEHVDQNKMQMVPEKDKIILKFPKLKS
ncbi:MAG: Hsp20 family protein [Pseudobdellovibrio sp.]